MRYRLPKISKQTICLCGAAAFAALFLFSAAMLARSYADGKQSADAFTEAAELIRKEPEPTSDAEDDTGTDETAAGELSATEKYAAVYAENSDFVGWLTIPDTGIDYPVMQTPGNPDFYLKHGFDRAYSAYGVPYAQENCRLGLSDNVILYGHHMKNGTMFSGLCKYEDEGFYEGHQTFTFDTLSGFWEYEIIAVLKTVAYSGDGFRYYDFVDAESEEDFNSYVSACKELSLYNIEATAEYGDQLLTLSTCEYSRTNGRMVVVAKKVSESLEADGDA